MTPIAASGRPAPTPLSTIWTPSNAISRRGQAICWFLRGAWEKAERLSHHLLQQTRLSSVTRSVALTTLGQIHARSGITDAAESLDEALALADRTGQLLRRGPVRAVRAEAALLAGDTVRARAE